MVKRYRTRGTGVTTNREEARANRKLQLVHSSSFPGERGLTLMEKMEIKLDQTIMERNEKAEIDPDELSDQDADDHLDWMLRNEGKVQGMLIMIGIMRSTNMKIELQRSRDRIKYNYGKK